LFTTLGDYLNWAEQAFSEAKLHFGHGTDNPWDEAVAIALYVLALPPNVDASAMDRPLEPAEEQKLIDLANRRISERIPVPYLTHTAWLGGYPFFVDERVIIPRSPIVELIENRFSPWLQKPPNRILDLCTGSGCLAIICAKVFQNAKVDGLDIDEKALEVAKINIEALHVSDRVSIIKSDLFSAFRQTSQAANQYEPDKLDKQYEPYDIIISNPPYVPTEEFHHLPAEYTFEPIHALEAGDEGLDLVRRILKDAPNYLTEDGILIVEVGSAAEYLEAAYPNVPFTWLEFERGGDGIFLLTAKELKCLTIS
jgi:ribosomal protein L3 glutamine methyltransferase